jgi:hypothetical protein
MKKYLLKVAGWTAVGLGTVAFLVWKFATWKKNIDDARRALEHGTPYSKEVISKMELKNTETEQQIFEIKTMLEEQTKEEIIYAFKKAFHVPATDPSYPGPGSAGSDT